MERTGKRVLILTTQNEKMEITARYLTRRGWVTQLSTDLKAVLSGVLTNSPDFVFLSIHLAGNQLPTIQKLMSRLSGTTLILFSEIATMENSQRLINTGAEHIIYPSAGGPAFDRALHRIVLEGKDRQETQRLAQTLKEETYWPYGSVKRVRASTTISVLNESLRFALHKACGFTPKNSRQMKSLGEVTQLTCVEIRSQSFRGYLVAARASNQKLNDGFMRQVRDFVAEALFSSGEKFYESEVYSAQVTDVNFKFWTSQHAECYQTATYQGEEVGIAFFSDEKLKIDEISNSREHMIGLDINEATGEAKAMFDLYLYLPANGRFVRYTRRGESLSDKQYEKLKMKAVTHLYFQRSDLRQWKANRVNEFLNEKIAEFKRPSTHQAASV